MRVRALFTLAALTLACLPPVGCATRHPADPARLSLGAAAYPDDAPAWPQRSLEHIERVVAPAPGVHDFPFSGVRLRRGRMSTVVDLIPVERIGGGVYGNGGILEVRLAPPVADPERRRILQFYSSQTATLASALPPGFQLPERFKPVVTQPFSVVGFDVLEPEAPIRGVAFSFPGLGGYNYVRPVTDELLGRGWVVIESDLPLEALSGRRGDLRTEYQLEHFAREFAREVDDRLADWAFGCESALAYLAQDRPELAGRPVVLLGFSAGTFGLPTVAARLRPRVRAAVLVGGGVDVLRISSASTLLAASAPVLWNGEPPTGDVIDRLSRAYLAASSLDPYHTAPALARIPVLQLHAANDRIVPAAAGELLYERLGRPERWTFNLGHELLFWRLPAYAGEIADWVEDAVRESPGNGPAGGAESAPNR